MFNIFNITSKKKAQPKRIEIDFQELSTQCLNNTRYLRASINTISGQIADLKSRASRQNSTRIKALVSYRDWLISKLEEEESEFKRFEKSLKKA